MKTKMKNRSSAKKRFKVTGTGKIKRAKGYRRHLLTKKSAKTKRKLRQTDYVHSADFGRIKKLLPYA